MRGEEQKREREQEQRLEAAMRGEEQELEPGFQRF